ncbi:MAG: CBS domain-containing protein [Planctomycetota bacterium]
MRDNHFLEAGWELGTIGEVVRGLPPRKVLEVEVSGTVRDAVTLMKKHGISQLPVADQGRLAGIVTEADLLEGLVDGRMRMETSLAEAMNRRVSTVSPDDPSSVLGDCFHRDEAALVVEDGRVVAVLTKIDLIDFLAKQEHPGARAAVPSPS